MEKDRLSIILENICGKEPGEKIEAQLKKFYPKLETSTAWRERFASRLEADGSFKTVSLMMKVGSCMDIILAKIREAERKKIGNLRELHEVQEFKRMHIGKLKEKDAKNNIVFEYDPQIALDRYIEPIMSYASAYVEEGNKMMTFIGQQEKQMSEHEASHNRDVFNDERIIFPNAIATDHPYYLAHVLVNNEFNLINNQTGALKTLDEQVEDLTNCNRDQMRDLVACIADDSLISGMAMSLIGSMVSNRDEILQNTPEMRTYKTLATKFPRYVFAACVNMIQNKEKLTTPQKMEDKINKKETVETAINLTKEKCGEIMEKLYPSAARTKAHAKVSMKDLMIEEGRE